MGVYVSNHDGYDTITTLRVPAPTADSRHALRPSSNFRVERPVFELGLVEEALHPFHFLLRFVNALGLLGGT